MSGNSSYNFLTYLGADKKTTLWKAGCGRSEARKMTDTGQSAWTTRWPLMSTRILKCCKESEREGYWGKLEIPSVNLGSGATGETEWDNSRSTTFCRQPVGIQKTNTIVGSTLGSRENRQRGARVNQKLCQKEYPVCFS